MENVYLLFVLFFVFFVCIIVQKYELDVCLCILMRCDCCIFNQVYDINSIRIINICVYMYFSGLVNINIKDKIKCFSKYKDYVRFLDVIFFIMIILIKFYVSMV